MNRSLSCGLPLAALLAAACSSSTPTESLADSGSPQSDASHKDAPSAPDASHADAGAHDAHVADAHQASDTGSDAALEAEADAGGPTDAGRPPPPSGDATPSTTRTLFALHHLWLGDSLPNATFTPDTTGTAWETFGYNIDGLLTTAASTDVCTLDTAANATTKDQVDGVGGIDNSFGKNVVPLLASALPNLSMQVSSAITSGSFNVLIGTTGLTNSPTQTNTGLTGAILSGAPYGGTPPLNDAGYFLPTDDWPVYSSSVKGSLDAGPSQLFDMAYVTNGTWVNGSPGDITLVLLLQNQPLILQIHEAVVSFTHTIDAHGQDHATNGFISGVLKTSEFLNEVNIVAYEQMYCAEAQLLLSFIAAASDIVHDGTNTSGVACDGISIGLAFDADGIAQPTSVVPSIDAGAAMGCPADGG